MNRDAIRSGTDPSSVDCVLKIKSKINIIPRSDFLAVNFTRKERRGVLIFERVLRNTPSNELYVNYQHMRADLLRD